MAGKPPLRVVLNRSDGSREELDASGIAGVVWTPRFKALPGVEQVRGGILQLRLEYDEEPGREWLRFDATRTRDPFHGVVWGELAGTVAGMLGADPNADHRLAPCASRWPVTGGEAPATDGSFLVGEMIWTPAAAKREAPAKARARKATPAPAPAQAESAEPVPVKKAPARKAAVSKAPAKKAPAKKAPAKKATASRAAARSAPARKAPARKAAAKKAPAKKAPAKKAPAKKAPKKAAAK